MQDTRSRSLQKSIDYRGQSKSPTLAINTSSNLANSLRSVSVADQHSASQNLAIAPRSESNQNSWNKNLASSSGSGANQITQSRAIAYDNAKHHSNSNRVQFMLCPYCKYGPHLESVCRQKQIDLRMLPAIPWPMRSANNQPQHRQWL